MKRKQKKAEKEKEVLRGNAKEGNLALSRSYFTSKLQSLPGSMETTLETDKNLRTTVEFANIMGIHYTHYNTDTL